MSSDKTQNKNASNKVTRSAQSRRKVLKSIAVGGGAVVTGKSLPNDWSKPVVESVLLPAHAETSEVEAAPPPPPPPAGSCSLGGTVEAFTFGDNSTGVFAIPGSYNSPNGGEIIVDPSISVDPGTTDSFNLTTVANAGDFVANDPAALNQNLTPDPTNGAIAFTSIMTSDYSTPFTMSLTVTPDNQSACGGPQVINITFSTPP